MKSKTRTARAFKTDRQLHIGKKVAGGTTGAVLGAVVGGPLGAVIGGVVGTAIGTAAEADYASRSAPNKPVRIKRRAVKPAKRSVLSSTRSSRRAMAKVKVKMNKARKK